MSHHASHRRKPELTGHQKQIRFFTRLAIVLCAVVTLAIFWAANHTYSFPHR